MAVRPRLPAAQMDGPAGSVRRGRRYDRVVTIEDVDDLAGLAAAGRVVSQVRDEMLAAVEPGITTGELDAIGRTMMREAGARSAPRLAYGFPGSTCISVNDEA